MRAIQHKKPLIGLVGGIGSGKSQVGAVLARHGGHLISADRLGHESLEQPAIREAVKKRWGEKVFSENGEVDRKKLGRIVFGSPVERTNLEYLVFPYIEERVHEEVARAEADPQIRFILLDAAIMLEVGWNNVCTWTVYVHTPRAIRIQRLEQSRGWTGDELAHRELAQWPLCVKAMRADVAIHNDSTLEQLEAQVLKLVNLWKLAA